MRIGIGFDVHRFSRRRKGLILGQVKFDYWALEGASKDADVLLHAISDAILGASGRSDIGTLFPPRKCRGIGSKEIIEEVIRLVKSDGFELMFIDSVIIAQKPKIGSRIDEIRETVRTIVGCEFNVRVKSPEGLGALGRAEGIGAMAVALLGRAEGRNR